MFIENVLYPWETSFDFLYEYLMTEIFRKIEMKDVAMKDAQNPGGILRLSAEDQNDKAKHNGGI